MIKPLQDCCLCRGTGIRTSIFRDILTDRTCYCVTEQINRYEELAREARMLCDNLIHKGIESNNPRYEYVWRLYEKATQRLWRRLNVLKAAGHEGALW